MGDVKAKRNSVGWFLLVREYVFDVFNSMLPCTLVTCLNSIYPLFIHIPLAVRYCLCEL